MLKKLRHLFYCSISLLVLPSASLAQINDVGLWLGVTVNKQFTRKIEGSISEQLRLYQDISQINLILTDVGAEYSFSKKLKAGFYYRFINSNHDNYYSKRHRFYLNVSWKEKIKFVSITLRERLQEQFNDVNSSETGKIPIWILRSKLTAKFDLDKKYSPYIAGEVYYLLDDPKEIDNIFTRVRYEAGITYDFNRIHSLNPFVLFQHYRIIDFNNLIYGITYSYSF